MVKQYCTGCHNAKSKAGNLDLDSIQSGAVPEHGAVWEKVVRRLRARSMPPAGMPRPKEAEYEGAVRSLTAVLDAAYAAKPDPGRTDTFRRLNRTEYQNAVRDLLAVDIDVSGLLPADEASHGFDNVTVGDLSPTLLEKYLAAARKISRLAVGSPLKAPGGDTFQLPPDLTQEDHFEGLPVGTRGGMQVKYTFPLDAEYDVQIRLARDRNEHVEGLMEPNDIELLVDGRQVQLFQIAPAGRSDHSAVDRHLTIRLPIKAGPHVVAAVFPKRPTTLLENERQPYPAHFNMDRHPRVHPAVYSLTVNGPYNATGPGDTPSRRLIFLCRPSSASEEEPCATRILSRLMGRAYRRPVTPADLQAPMRFFRETRGKDGFESGIEMALRAVLISPEFLFRVERDPARVAPGSAYRINELELASRLSFFLWSSLPDDELLDAAIGGKLRNPQELDRQVRRMLKDPRSATLVNNFAEQWLYLRNLASITPDMRLFPEFDDNLRRSFRRETELMVASVAKEDRSVLDLLRADYTFLNERLAKHYGIPNIYGSRFRRVTLPPGSHRGGLLRHGSILTVTSYATRTSPVIRGKWIMENILGTPPPPPPPAVPALKESNRAAGKVLTMRERLSEHRKNPACSGCHNLMDPVGFSLENYDAVGRWRTREETAPIDAAGGLPDGSKFDGVDGLEAALLQRPELFATTITEKLMTYALGRGVEPSDAPAVRRVVERASQNGYRFTSFVTGIVNSVPFQMRRTSDSN
jgi:mono/diheme cytochrome c family protein